MNIDDIEYLKKIKDRVDEIALKTGFGELTIKIEIKNGKPLYVIFVQTEERHSIK